MAGAPRRGGSPKTWIRPVLGATSPRIALRSDVLPAPFGPRMATNDPAATSSDRSLQMRRVPYSRVTPSNVTAGPDIALRLLRESLLQRVELRQHPLLEGLELRRDRFGDADHRYATRLGECPDAGGQR